MFQRATFAVDLNRTSFNVKALYPYNVLVVCKNMKIFAFNTMPQDANHPRHIICRANNEQGRKKNDIDTLVDYIEKVLAVFEFN